MHKYNAESPKQGSRRFNYIVKTKYIDDLGIVNLCPILKMKKNIIFKKDKKCVCKIACFYMYSTEKGSNSIRNKNVLLNGLVSRDFDWLQMILMNITWVSDVPPEVFFLLSFSYRFLSSKF